MRRKRCGSLGIQITQVRMQSTDIALCSTAEFGLSVGLFVVANDRGEAGFLSSFALDPSTGNITFIDRVDTSGHPTPDGIAATHTVSYSSGEAVSVANYFGQTVAIFRVNPTTGTTTFNLLYTMGSRCGLIKSVIESCIELAPTVLSRFREGWCLTSHRIMRGRRRTSANSISDAINPGGDCTISYIPYTQHLHLLTVLLPKLNPSAPVTG
ncbi:hypothetical protein BDV98DRAFT_51015 [Pterulicium gracile]|uniref:Lactonase, 7-bladed beta-propeller-domain-containing protein n=1 Tax=Pterulicium gracile TaxID=1884261 RepID=A0A5C3QJN3_9AGAR|nr:hypothetical protein BDV98DRAFT_51015 [Pterula gracilis]